MFQRLLSSSTATAASSASTSGRSAIRGSFQSTSFAMHSSTSTDHCSSRRTLLTSATNNSNQHGGRISSSRIFATYTRDHILASVQRLKSSTTHFSAPFAAVADAAGIEQHPCGRSYINNSLLLHPRHAAADLGQPMPASAHAISVCMPLWQHVVAYEQGDAAMHSQLYCGYPRFCLHPFVQQLFMYAAAAYGNRQQLTDGTADDTAYIFPSRDAAERCVAFVLKQQSNNNNSSSSSDISHFGQQQQQQQQHRVHIHKLREAADSDNHVLTFHSSLKQLVHKHWQHYGDVVSSRQCHAILEGRWQTSSSSSNNNSNSSDTNNEGINSKHLIKQRIADATHSSSSDVFLYPSGMNALSQALRLAQELGGEYMDNSSSSNSNRKQSIQVGFPYLDSLKLQNINSSSSSSCCHLFVHTDAAALTAIDTLLATGNINVVVTEYPSNPLLTVVDLQQLYSSCKRHDVLLIVDDTVASFAAVNTIDHCDAVVSSLSKWFSGVGDVMAGSMVLNSSSKQYTRMQQWQQQHYSDCLYRCDAIQLEHNSRDFVQRVSAAVHTTNELTAMLRRHPLIDAIYTVNQPLDSSNSSSSSISPSIQKLSHGVNAMFSFTLNSSSNNSNTTPTTAAANNERATQLFHDHIRVSKGPSLGTNFTLLCPYTLLAHYHELDYVRSLGVPKCLLRVSVGGEESGELQGRFWEALEAVEQQLEHDRCNSSSSSNNYGSTVQPYIVA